MFKFDAAVFASSNRRVEIDGLDLRIYQNKRSKPFVNSRFGSAERLQEMLSYYEQCAKNDAQYYLPHDFKVGDIMVESWGFEQTNIDFYEVVGVTKTGIRIKKIRSTEFSYNPGTMTGYVVPEAGQYTQDDEAKLVKATFGSANGPRSFKTYLYKWKGDPVRFSSYA